MRIEELDKIYEYLEKEVNKQGLFYFQFEGGNINAKVKSNNHTFAQFYTREILNIINGVYDKTEIIEETPKKIEFIELKKPSQQYCINDKKNKDYRETIRKSIYDNSCEIEYCKNKLNKIIDYLNNMEE